MTSGSYGIPKRSVNIPTPGPYNAVYICTRFRVRSRQLIQHADYMRMLNMSVPQIARFIGEHGYAKEIHIVSSSLSDFDRIETAVIENLATSFRSVRTLVAGPIRTLTEWYLLRWDIINVMAILRGKKRGLLASNIRNVLIPAGDLDENALAFLLEAETFEDVIDRLENWVLFPVLTKECGREPGSCLFSRLETRLYQQYYTDLIRNCRSSVPGADLFLTFLMLEIDLNNFRNLLRLRAGNEKFEIQDHLIAGGSVPVSSLLNLYQIQDRETFLEAFSKTRLHPILIDAYRELSTDKGDCTAKADSYICDRWIGRKRPIHEIEMAVTRIRLAHVERVSKHHPFSVLPVLMYLERKKYEVANIRAITRGIEDKIPPDQIQRYIVT